MSVYSNNKDVQATTNPSTLAELSVGSRYKLNDLQCKGAIIQLEDFSKDLGWYSYSFVFRPDDMEWPFGGAHFLPNSNFHRALKRVDYQLHTGDKVCYFGPENSYGLGDIFPPKGTEGVILSINEGKGMVYVEVLWPEGTVEPNKNKDGKPISYVWSSGLLKKDE